MKYIDLFLSSTTTDLKGDRDELVNYVRYLNEDVYKSRNVEIRMHLLSNQYEDIEKWLQDSEYFYVLLYKEADDKAIEQFNIALNNSKTKIYTYFKECENPEEGVKEFTKKLDKVLSHYYSRYKNLDTVKLNWMEVLSKNPKTIAKLAFRDNKVWVNDKECTEIDLNNVPFYANNENLIRLKKELEESENDFLDAKLLFLNDPDNEENETAYFKIRTKRNELKEKVQKFELQLLKISMSVFEMSDGREVTLRFKKAKEQFELGNIEAMQSILDDEERLKEKTILEANIEKSKEVLVRLNDEALLKIEGIKAKGITTENVERIIKLYEEIKDTIEKNNLDKKPLIEYANFLHAQKRFKKAQPLFEQLLEHFKEVNNQSSYARICNDLACVNHDMNNYAEAEKLLIEALDIYRKLSVQNAEVYASYVASMSNNLASLYQDMNNYPEAEKLHKEALDIYRKLSVQNAEVYTSYVAWTCNNLALLYQKMNNYPEAEKLYKEALDIYRKLSVQNAEVYTSYVAWTSNNLASLYQDVNNYSEAEKLYKESLEIRRKLSAQNEEVYASDVARTCNNLALLYQKMNNYSEAEKLYKEALDIYRKLSAQNAEVYASYVAGTSNNLASLYQDMNNYPEAEKLCKEALDTYIKLSAQNEEVYQSDVASTANNLASLYQDMNNYPETEKLYKEALDIYRKLSVQNAEVYASYVATTSNNLALLCQDMNNYPEAEKLYKEALDIYRKLSVQNAEVYASYVACTCNNLASLYKDMNNYPEAEKILKESSDIYKNLHEQNPEVYEANVAMTFHNLAGLYMKMKKHSLSKQYFDETINLYKELAKKTPSVYKKKLADSRMGLATLYKKMGKMKEYRNLMIIISKMKF